MEAILKFNLPEENHKFRAAVDGVKWVGAMMNIDSQLRTIIKHSTDWTDEQLLAFQEARDILHQSMDNHNLNFDK